MPFDDDDNPPAGTAPLSTIDADDEGLGETAAAEQAEEEQVDEDEDAGVQDFRKFAALTASSQQKTGFSSKTIRHGEKDYESHGTRVQVDVLEGSRRAMHETLSWTRAHRPENCVRGWYFPDHCAERAGGAGGPVAPEVGDGKTDGEDEDEDEDAASGLLRRERVVVLESAKGAMIKSTGRVLKGLGKDTPGWDRTWLLPEEALYLVERGDMQLWWPQRGIEEVLGTGKEGDSISGDRLELGLPLSFQAAYALFIGRDGERGKISLEKYQVYANLRRTGYLAYRANLKTARAGALSRHTEARQSLWQWLFSLVSPTTTSPPSKYPHLGPLVKPGLYRSYDPVFAQLHLITRHTPSAVPSTGPPQGPFKIFYHVYKARSGFSKANPPAPDFRIAVVSARTTSLPTLEQMTSFLESTAFHPPDEKMAAGKGIGFTYKRLKHGWRDAIMAVVDSGFISYLRFTEMAFGEERLFESFNGSTGRGGKKGGRGQGGRGGRRGRGGRGGKRGG